MLTKNFQKAGVRSYMPASAEADIAEVHQSFSCESAVKSGFRMSARGQRVHAYKLTIKQYSQSTS